MRPALLLTTFSVAVTAQASVVNWTNTNSGNWDVATNWSSGTAPGPSDDVSITAPGSYTVTQNVSVTVKSLTLGGASGTQTLTNAGFGLSLLTNSMINSNGLLAVTSGGSIGGVGPLTVNGRLLSDNCSLGGFRAGSVINVAPGGTLQLVGSGNHVLWAALTNSGTIEFTGGTLFVQDYTILNNLAGGVFDIQGDLTITANYNVGTIINAGILRKSAGAGAATIQVPLNNSGTLNAQTGQIQCSGATTFNDGTVLSGDGTNAVSGNLTLNGTFNSENLAFVSGGVTGSGTLTGTAQWQGSQLGAGYGGHLALVIAPTATLELSGGANHVLWSRLTNLGTIELKSGPLYVQGGSVLQNAAGAVFDIQDDLTITASYNVGVITNSGTIRKNAGSADTIVGVPLINSGTLNVESGRVAYGNGSQFNSGTSFTGTGTNYLYNGTVTLNGGLTSENLEIAPGVTVAGTHTLSGTVRWTGGTVSGAMTIATNGTLNITGTADRVLSGSLNNQGLLLWSDVNGFYFANGHLTNLIGGVFEIQNNLTLMSSGGAPNVNNGGTIRKTSGGGTTIIGVPLINSGTLDVQSGMVAYVNGSQFNSGTSFTGTGTNYLYNGTVTFNGSLTSGNLEIAPGVTVAGIHTLSGTVRWTGGTVSGAMTIATNGTLNITGTADRVLSGSLNNQGLLLWSDVNGFYFANGHLTNLIGGVFEIQNNLTLTSSSGVPNVNNGGTIRKTSGGGTTIIGVPLINSGTLDVQSGMVAYVNGSQFNAGTAFAGAGTNLVYTGYCHVQRRDPFGEPRDRRSDL